MDKDGNIQVAPMLFENLLEAPLARFPDWFFEPGRNNFLCCRHSAHTCLTQGPFLVMKLWRFCNVSVTTIESHCAWRDALDDTQEQVYFIAQLLHMREPYGDLTNRLVDKWKQSCFTSGCFPDQVSHAVYQHVRQAEHPVHLYTDECCHHPQHRVTRFASYSIIMDCCDSDRHRREIADQYLCTGSLPDPIAVIAARCRHDRKFSRAELSAIVRACEALPVIYLPY